MTKSFNVEYFPSSNNNIKVINIEYSVITYHDEVVFKPYLICVNTYLFGEKLIGEEELHKYLNTYELRQLEDLTIQEYKSKCL